MEVSVIGAGSFGTAMAILLSNCGHSVRLWAYLPEEKEEILRYGQNRKFLPGVNVPQEVSVTCDMRQAVEGSQAIFLAVPSSAVESVARQLSQFVTNCHVINLAKGLYRGKRLSLVLEEYFDRKFITVVSGPSHAEEIAKGILTTVVAVSPGTESCEFVQNLLMNPVLRVYTGEDIVGVELGGALKNVIALAAGIIEGLGFGDNTKAALITRGIAEMTRLGVKMGAKEQTFGGLSGIGDLIVTCCSRHSRNLRAGWLIGRGRSCDQAVEEVGMVVEGIPTAEVAWALAKEHQVDTPIIEQVNRVLFHGQLPMQAAQILMNRDKKAEFI